MKETSLKRITARMRLLAMLLTLLAAGTAQAVSGTETITARGYAQEPQQAVTNALVQAVRQAGGVTLAVDPDFRRRVDKWVLRRDGDVSTWIGTSTSVADPRLPTLGSLAGYKVTGVSKIDDGLWRADVQARVMRTKPVGPDRSALPAIVIAPFSSGAGDYQLGTVTINAADARRRLQADLVEAFTQSGRFRVLDRAHQAQRQRELATVAQGSVDPQQWIKLGRNAGADVLLVGTIEDLDIGDDQKRYYGAKVRGYEPRVRVRYRLINVASGEIITADLFNWRQSETSIRELARQQKIDDWNHPERLADVVYPRIARAIAGTATDVLYPVRVLKTDGDTVYLSQGKGRLENGQTLQVVRGGDTVKDPDTGQVVSLQSAPLATLLISEVRNDYGIAHITTGGPVEAGDRVRHAESVENKTAPPAGHPMTPGSSAKPIQWDGS